jgi:type I restriction enzyme, S subunit
MLIERTLSEIAIITMGTSPKGFTYNRNGEGLPLLNGPTEFGDVYPNCTLFTNKSIREGKPGDLIFCVRGSTTGRMNWADRVYSLGRGVCSIRGKSISDTRFIKYCLDWKLGSLLNLASGGTFPNLTQETIRNFSIPYPPLPTQRKIASILSAYDDLIENNQRRIKILEEMAQNLYREWFVKFRFPGHENVRFVDSPLGRIPEGWEVKRIDDIAVVHRGRSYRSSDLLEEGGIPFVNLKCIDRDGGFRRDGIKRYGGEFKENQKVAMGDIVMAVTDMTQERRIVARAGRVPTLDTGFGVISMDLVKIEPIAVISSDFLYSYFRGSDFPDNVKQHANGANVLHLSPDRIKEYEFILPSEELREQFVSFSNSVYNIIENLYRKNDILRKSRDLLLPKLISGEVDVSELDVTIPEEN